MPVPYWPETARQMRKIHKIINIALMFTLGLEVCFEPNAAYYYPFSKALMQKSGLRPPLICSAIDKDTNSTQSLRLLFPSEFLSSLKSALNNGCLIYNTETLSGIGLDSTGENIKISGKNAITEEDVNLDLSLVKLSYTGKEAIKDKSFLTQFQKAHPSKDKIVIILDEENFKNKNSHPILPFIYLIPHEFRCIKISKPGLAGDKTTTKLYFYMIKVNDLSKLRGSSIKTYFYKHKYEQIRVRDMQAYKDAVLDGTELIAGALIPQTRIRGLNSILLKNYPDFIVIDCRVNDTGRLDLGGRPRVFQSRKDLIGKPLLAIRSDGSWLKVIKKEDGEEAYIRPNPESPDAIFLEGKVENGKLIEGTFVGILPRYGADEELKRYKNPIVCNVLLDKEGGLFKLGRFFFKQKKGYENHRGAMIVCNERGEPIKVYAKDGNLLWFDPNSMDELTVRAVYVGAEFQNGKVEGGEMVYASELGIPSRILEKYPDCIIGNIDIPQGRGIIEIGNKVVCRRPELADTKGYTAIQRNGRIVYIYSKERKLIYSNTEKDRNALFTTWRFENGRFIWSNFVRAFEYEVLADMVSVLRNCAVINVKADINGTIGSVANKRVVQQKADLKDREDLTVIFSDSEPIAVCGPDGTPLHIIDKGRFTELEIEQMSIKIDKNVVLSLIRNFGAVGAFTIIRRLLNIRTPTVTRVMSTYLNILSDEEKAGFKGTRDDAKEFFKATRKIFSQINIRYSDAQWLSNILIEYMYRFVVKDKDAFFNMLFTEIRNTSNPKPLIAAYKKVYAHYRKAAKVRLQAKLKKELFLFQHIGAQFIIEHKKALLADECGLGKTIQAIAAALSCKEGGAKKVLIVSPKSAMDWWKQEIISSTEIGADSVYLWGENKNLSGIDQNRFVVVNYEAMRGKNNSLKRHLLSMSFDFIIIDEAHRMRNESLQTTAILEFNAEYKLLLSATPLVGSKIKRLFFLLHWLYPELFPSLERFSRYYARNPAALRSALSGFMLSRAKADVAVDIPKREIKDIYVELSGKQAEVYKKWRDNFSDWLISSGNWFNKGLVFLKLEKLRQAAISSTLVDKEDFVPDECLEGSGKYQKALEILKDERKKGKQVVIFTRYVKVVEHLRRLLGHQYPGQVLCLTGRYKGKARSKILEKFQRDKSISVLIATYGTAGESLNIQSASSAIFVDYPWTYQEFLHAMDRIHRIGQKEAVTVYRLISRGTVDEHILKMLEKSKYLHRFLIMGGELPDAYDKDAIIASISKEFKLPSEKVLRTDEEFWRNFHSRSAPVTAIARQPEYIAVGTAKIDSSVVPKIKLTSIEEDVLKALANEKDLSLKLLSGEELGIVEEVMKGESIEALDKKYGGKAWPRFLKSAMIKLGAKTIKELPSAYANYPAIVQAAQSKTQKRKADHDHKKPATGKSRQLTTSL